MDAQIGGDPRGVRACEEMKARQKDDLADALDAAGDFGRAFLREEMGEEYRIWEMRLIDESRTERHVSAVPSKLEVSLFAQGRCPLALDRSE